MTALDGVDLIRLAAFGERRGVQVISDTPEARLVLFSLQGGQKASGRGEPRVHLLALEGEGELWCGERRLAATAGTLLACEAGDAHGARAGEGPFLVLGIITPRPSST